MAEEAAVNTDQMSFLEELYVARCKDTLEQPSREEFLRFSSRLKSKVSGHSCCLRNQHLGVSAANTLSKFLRNRADLVKLDLYWNLIRDHGVQVVSHLLQLNPSIRMFNIGCNDLSDKSAPYIVEILNQGNLSSLQLGTAEKALHPNKLTTATLDAIADAVVKANKLEALGLNNTDLSPKQNSTPANSLIKMLSRTTSLKVLSLSGCEISSQDFLDVIENGLSFNSSLQRLNISHNQLNADVGVRLADFFNNPIKCREIDTENETEIITETDKRTRLFYLDVSYNLFTSKTTEALIEPVTYSYLGYLDISGNEIGDEGAAHIASILTGSKTLVEVHLADNKITPQGGVLIAKALRENQVLTTLNLSKNRLEDATAFSIAEVLTVNSTLRTLTLNSAMISNAGGVKIAEASVACTSLTSILMNDNFFTEDAGTAMESLFRENTTVLKIDVSGTQINHFAFHALNEICQRNLGLLKQKEQRPLRNQLVKSQYSVVELKRKEEILAKLVAKKEELQEQIDTLNEKIQNLKSEEEITAMNLTKQIQEKEQQMLTEKADFEEKMKKLEEDLHEFEAKREQLAAQYESQLQLTQETRTKIEAKRKELNDMTDEFEKKKAAILEEIKTLNEASQELSTLAQDPEALRQMEALPEFIHFEDEEKTEEPELAEIAEPKPEPARRRRRRTKPK